MISAKKYRMIAATAFLIALPVLAGAQEFYMETKVDARLQSILTLNVDPEVRIEFEITRVNDNLYQITKYPDDVPFSVESTGNWNLAITASTPYFRGVSDPTQVIPIDFISFYIESRGQNWDNGPFSNIANKTKDTIIPLTEDRNVVLANGRKNNIGGSNKNSFVLRWDFNFEKDMTKMREFSNLRVREDQFIGHFYITLSESHVSGTSINTPAQTLPVIPDNPAPDISGTMPQTSGLSASEIGRAKDIK